ncbi:hypothetical protein LWI28_027706 [Acer negundo]|nr:hypothetical protein LWI28_005069 [Acer negundo]KAI9182671.1 hypothetical protein LWI28_027706 [Acer negundo]
MLRVRVASSEDCLGKFLRVRVAILVDKPLRRFLRVDVLGDGEETVMPIQYERLPNFCFRCGLLGHMLRECPENDKPLIDRELTYGTWMRAAGPVRNPMQRSWDGTFDSRNGMGNRRANNLVEEVDAFRHRSLMTGKTSEPEKCGCISEDLVEKGGVKRNFVEVSESLGVVGLDMLSKVANRLEAHFKGGICANEDFSGLGPHLGCEMEMGGVGKLGIDLSDKGIVPSKGIKNG